MHRTLGFGVIDYISIRDYSPPSLSEMAKITEIDFGDCTPQNRTFVINARQILVCCTSFWRVNYNYTG